MQTKLTRKIIKEIVQYYRTGMSWKKIAQLTDIHRGTLFRWKKASKTATHGLLKELKVELIAARNDIILQATDTVVERATKLKRTIKRKETFDRNNEPFTEVTTIIESADAYLALKVLERLQPERWAPKYTDAQNSRRNTQETGKKTDTDKKKTDTDNKTEEQLNDRDITINEILERPSKSRDEQEKTENN
ncbi:MAG: helix-turn-helix domain containing protein [Candidatus Poribacteria bacterium]|nr:helix-turn-helix domain containing protein [Candidatus Poribacteria bacterium]